jgi:uncharacterized membrane protein
VHLDPWFYIFGADILTLAGLSLIATGFLRRVFKNNFVFYFILAGITAAAGPYLNNIGSGGAVLSHVASFFRGTEAGSYFPFFPWFAYVLAGYSFYLFIQHTQTGKKIDVQNHLLWFIPLFIFVIVTLPYAAGVSGNLYGKEGYYHHGIVFYGWVMLFMLSFVVVINRIEINFKEMKILRLIRWIGQKVTLLYVIQWLIIGNIAAILFRTQDLFQVFGWFFIVTMTTLVAGYIFDMAREKRRLAK